DRPFRVKRGTKCAKCPNSRNPSYKEPKSNWTGAGTTDPTGPVSAERRQVSPKKKVEQAGQNTRTRRIGRNDPRGPKSKGPSRTDGRE
ncbi:hypothetical protein KI387_042273, partial [Taxus chinensis]